MSNTLPNGQQKILIFDTTLRDGEQSPGASLTIPEKIVIAKQLEKLGVDIIEAGFPAASEGDFEAVQKISETIKDTIVCGLARCTKEDIQTCWDAIKAAKHPRIHVFIGTSKSHVEDKLKASKEKILEKVSKEVSFAKSLCNDIEFSPEDASRTDIDYMCDVIKTAISAGATTINIPDTVGYATPKEFADRITDVIENIPEIKDVTLSVHCHNDLGLAVANSLAGINAGADQVECTINGLGERAGNAALEEIAMILKIKKNFNCTTSINHEEIYKTSRLVSNLTGIDIQKNKAIVGENAFAHEAGIHQHGVLQSKNTYEIMDPADIGWIGENIVIGKHSGKHAVDSVLKEHGYDLTKDQLEEVTKRIKTLADKQKNVAREEVIALANEVLSKEEETIILDEISVVAGNKVTPTATVRLIIDGKEHVASGYGVGPVDAAASAIRSILGDFMKLKEYNLRAITGGTDALAEVILKVEDKDKKIYLAEGIDEDVIMASVKALIKGANKVK